MTSMVSIDYKLDVKFCDIRLRLEDRMEKEDITLLEAETNDLCS